MRGYALVELVQGERELVLVAVFGVLRVVLLEVLVVCVRVGLLWCLRRAFCCSLARCMLRLSL